ncbi:MAG: tail fiber domain-containing protein [Bacteroidota bacterium]
MRFLLTLCMALALTLMFSISAQAQTSPSNSLGIFPPGGPFNPNAKFTAIGESGGAPGPTANGCDLYGFRAQFAPDLAVNLGVQRAEIFIFPPNPPFIFNVPTLSFENPTFWITGRSTTTPTTVGPDFGCGPLLAFYSATSTTSYTIYGSANAVGGMWMASDRKLKRNIKPIRGAIETVQQLAGVTYNYNTDVRPELRLSNELQYGFIAQEVEKVLPELVRPAITPTGEEDDYVVMNYDGIIPVLTEAIKEQQEVIEEQEIRLESQEAIIDQLLNRLQEIESKLKIEREVQTPAGPFGEIKLNQNRPNPADGMTIIEYTIPSEIAQAQLVIFDITGAEVNRFEVNPGFGSVEIQAGELAAGTYLYTIEVEGQSVARRKMIIQ